MPLKSNRYTLLDCVSIPMKAAPFRTALLLLNQLLNALLPSVQVLVTAAFVDTALGIFDRAQPYGAVFPPLFGLMAIVAYRYLSSTLIGMVNLRLTMNLNEQFRSAIVDKRAALQYAHVENNDTWDLISRACGNPVGRITGGLSQLMEAAGLVVQVISVLAIIMIQIWWAALLILAMAVPLFFLALRAGKTNYEASKEAAKHQRRADYLGGVLTGRETVEERALFGYTGEINDEWYQKYETARLIDRRVEVKNFIHMKAASLITVAVSLLIIGVLLPSLGAGQLTIGMFMGLVTATFDLVQQMSFSLSYVTSELANTREYLKDLTAFSRLSERDDATALPAPLPEYLLRTIEFRNVSFRYPGTDRLILDNCSFLLSLEAGRHFAFVGTNGAGKTTVTKLLTGMYDNYEGDILLNGKSLREYPLPVLKSLFSVVYQDFARYCVSLRDNILLGNVLETDEDRVRHVLRTMELDDAVNKLGSGIDTPLGRIKDNGVDLSGGEWQRVAIARTLYSRAQLLILDEPTAALDPIAESRVYELFGAVSKGKSALFITHRLGAARLADRILVIDGGCVAEQGSHDELMARGGIYAAMFDSQKGWYAHEA